MAKAWWKNEALYSFSGLAIGTFKSWLSGRQQVVSPLGLKVDCAASPPLGIPVFALGRRLIARFQQIAAEEWTLWYEWGYYTREHRVWGERCCRVIPWVDWWVAPLYLLFTGADRAHSSYFWSYKKPITWGNAFQQMTVVFLSQTHITK